MRDPITDPQMNFRPGLAQSAFKKWLNKNPSVAGTPFELSMVLSISIFVDSKTVLEAASNPDFESSLQGALRDLLQQRIQPIDFESIIRLAQMVAEFA